MTVTATEKPSNAPSSVIIYGGSITLGSGSPKWVIQVQRSQWEFYTTEREITGDGDGAPVWQNNQLVYGRFTLLGWMVASQTVGIGNLADQTTSVPVIGFNFGPDVGFPAEDDNNAAILMTEINIIHDYRSEVNALAMAGFVTDTDLSAAAYDVGPDL